VLKAGCDAWHNFISLVLWSHEALATYVWQAFMHSAADALSLKMLCWLAATTNGNKGHVSAVHATAGSCTSAQLV
jgi:hypothetical protein